MKKQVFFLGLSGFPYGMAAISKQKMLSKTLMKEDWEVTVICNRSVHPQNREIEKKGQFEGIRYRYLFNPHRKGNFIMRNLQKLIAPFLETSILFRLIKKADTNVAILSNSNSFFNSVWYYIISKLFGFKLVHNLAELYKNREGTTVRRKVNNFLFNRYGLYFFDAYIPISQAIIEHFRSTNKKWFYIPTLTDIAVFDSVEKNKSDTSYFLFCGSAAYYKSIEFLLDALKNVENKAINLILVTGGTRLDMKHIQDKINSDDLSAKVDIRTNIPNQELFALYKSATALLLPMFDTIQDNARFPHKLSEYLASGIIVVSNPVGELKRFLKDKESVLFSDAGNVQEYTKNLNWVLENPDQAKKIGLRGQQVCSDNFYYATISKDFNKFLLQLQ